MSDLCNRDEVFTARCELILWLLRRQKLVFTGQKLNSRIASLKESWKSHSN